MPFKYLLHRPGEKSHASWGGALKCDIAGLGVDDENFNHFYDYRLSFFYDIKATHFLRVAIQTSTHVFLLIKVLQLLFIRFYYLALKFYMDS